jgi:hypothetical protein
MDSEEISPKIKHRKKIIAQDAEAKKHKTEIIGFKYRLIKGDKMVKISIGSNGNTYSEYVGRVSKHPEVAKLAKDQGLI